MGSIICYRYYFSPYDVYSKKISEFMRFFPCEFAHDVAIFACKNGLMRYPISDQADDSMLESDVMGLNFKNPIGLGAGFDKKGECFNNLAKLGFGFIEVGTVTSKPHKGNPKPRMLRLEKEKAIVNKCGFNNLGVESLKKNITSELSKNPNKDYILGTNIGVTAYSDDILYDYKLCANYLKDVSNYITINVSSPNTVGLRTYQTKEHLGNILKNVREEVNKNSHKNPRIPRILVKLSPDLNIDQLDNLLEFFQTPEGKVDGIILTNTTIQRPENIKVDPNFSSAGLSGQPLSNLSTKMVEHCYRKTKGKIPIIGVGGIFSGKDAFEKISHGASLVQVYTGMIYEGPYIAQKIKAELIEILK